MTPPFDRDEKRAQIARAAVKVFAEKGIDRARMTEVALAAGVGKGTIYEYFRSKDELFEFAVNRFFETLSADLHTQMTSVDDPVRQLEIFITGTFESIRSAGSEVHIIFEIWAEGVRSGVEYFDLRAMYSGYRELIGRIIEEGIRRGRFRRVDAGLTAAIIIGALDGMLLQWILFGDAFELDTAPDEFINLMMGGLLADTHQ